MAKKSQSKSTNKQLPSPQAGYKSKSRTWYQFGGKADAAYILKNLHNNVHSTNKDKQHMQYQPPTLYTPSRGTWRISWYNIHPGTGLLQRVQKTFDLNRIRDLHLRYQFAESLAYELWTMLRDGYNYFTYSKGMADTDNITKEMTMYTLMQEMLQVRCLGKKPRTADSYRSLCNVFCQWLKDNKLAGIEAHLFTAAMFQKYIVHKKKEGSGNRSVNDYISFVKTCMKKAVDLQYLISNPIAKIDSLPDEDSSMYEAITDAELITIRDHLKANHLQYYIYTGFTAHQFIRPYHIAFIKASDINYEKKLLRVCAEASKNRKVKYKQLMPEFCELLIKNNYHLLPGDMYLFGKGFEPAKHMAPSLSKRSAQKWKKEVIEGLKINKKMYALKHTAGQFYVNENDQLDAGWLQHQMEHSSLTETEAYIHKRKTKHLNTDNVNLIQY